MLHWAKGTIYRALALLLFSILDRFNVPSTIFVPSGLIGKHNLWDSGKNNLKRNLMNARQLLELKQEGLVTFGSHSIDHQSFRNLSINEMRKQATVSKETLEELFNHSIKMFSYPYGYFSNLSTNVISDAGYEIGVTTRWGTMNSKKHILRLKRISFLESDDYDIIRAKIEGKHDLYYFRGVGSKLRSIADRHYM